MMIRSWCDDVRERSNPYFLAVGNVWKTAWFLMRPSFAYPTWFPPSWSGSQTAEMDGRHSYEIAPMVGFGSDSTRTGSAGYALTDHGSSCSLAQTELRVSDHGRRCPEVGRLVSSKLQMRSVSLIWESERITPDSSVSTLP